MSLYIFEGISQMCSVWLARIHRCLWDGKKLTQEKLQHWWKTNKQMSEYIKERVDGEGGVIYWRLTGELKDRCWRRRCSGAETASHLLCVSSQTSFCHLYQKKKRKAAASPVNLCAGSRERRQMHHTAETDGSTLRSCAEATSVFAQGSTWRRSPKNSREQRTPLAEKSTLPASKSIHSLSLLAGGLPAELLLDIRATGGWDRLPSPLLFDRKFHWWEIELKACSLSLGLLWPACQRVDVRYTFCSCVRESPHQCREMRVILKLKERSFSFEDGASHEEFLSTIVGIIRWSIHCQEYGLFKWKDKY